MGGATWLQRTLILKIVELLQHSRAGCSLLLAIHFEALQRTQHDVEEVMGAWQTLSAYKDEIGLWSDAIKPG